MSRAELIFPVIFQCLKQVLTLWKGLIWFTTSEELSCYSPGREQWATVSSAPLNPQCSLCFSHCELFKNSTSLSAAGSTDSTLCFVLEDLGMALNTKTAILSLCSRCQSHLVFPFHSHLCASAQCSVQSCQLCYPRAKSVQHPTLELHSSVLQSFSLDFSGQEGDSSQDLPLLQVNILS